MKEEKSYPGHKELFLDTKTGEVHEEFVPDDYYEYVFTGICEDKRGRPFFVDAVTPPQEEGKDGRCDGMFYGYPFKERRPPFRWMITLYPFARSGEGMHPKLFAKRNIPKERLCSVSYFKNRYQCDGYNIF